MLPSTIAAGVVSSAGSKVMLTGGYLVLHKPNNGLVMGVDARLHTGIYPLLQKNDETDEKNDQTDEKDEKNEKNDQKSITFSGQTLSVQQFDNNTTSYPIVILTPQLRLEPLFLQLILKENEEIQNSSKKEGQEGKKMDQKAGESEIIDKNSEISSISLESNYEFELIGDYSKNSFVSKSLHYSLISISALISKKNFKNILSKGLLIDIRGDRSFYSSQPVLNQHIIPGIQYTLKNDQNIKTEDFFCENPIDYNTKTGLGSSAAVVSSLVTALFSYFDILPQDNTQSDNVLTKTRAYRVAQVAHCIAQGKVGSGFDVATAFYGTQTYCRFSPHLLSQIMQTPLENNDCNYKILLEKKNQNEKNQNENKNFIFFKKEENSKPNPYSNHEMNSIFLSIITKQWDDTVNPFSLPKYLNIILADVQGGSETPGMVKKVEEWKKNGDEISFNLWNKISEANIKIENHFQNLNKFEIQSPNNWLYVLNTLSTLPSSKWNNEILNSSTFNQKNNENIENFDICIKIGQELVQMVNNFNKVRELLRKMGNLCNVPIEPQSQTELIDKTCEQNGVLFSGVPGAGGFDAVFAVIIQTPQTANEIRTNIINVWKNNGQNDDKNDKNDDENDDKNVENVGQIFCLPVGIDQHGGVQTRKSYKDFAKWL